jgi:predicted metal-dependent hydrolase
MPWRPETLPSGTRPAVGESARTIELGERAVPYVLRRARRRTIGLTIDHRGLRVGAPHRASLRDVESAILHHGEWVRKKLDEWRSRPTAAPLQILDGLHLPVLGSPVEIRLALGANRCVWNLQMAKPTLTLCLRSPDEAPRVLEQVLRARACALFAERLAHYAPLLGVAVPRLSLSAARTRWGSCSPRTGIRLNWRLIHFPPSVVDYVVVHEVAHLREMNHSPDFWAVVERLCPNYRALRAELRDLAKTIPTLV